MKQLEIRASEWSDFLDAFSRQHEGWLVTVEDIPHAAGGSRVEARELPLQGVFVDDSREHNISIAVGRTADDHLTHTISRPTRLIAEQNDAGADEGLTIERRAGRSTQIRFRAPARPDEVDGVAR
jgi:hypothetical protein